MIKPSNTRFKSVRNSKNNASVSGLRRLLIVRSKNYVTKDVRMSYSSASPSVRKLWRNMKKRNDCKLRNKRARIKKRWRWPRNARKSDRTKLRRSRESCVLKRKKSSKSCKYLNSNALRKSRSRKNARDWSKKTHWRGWSSKSVTWILRSYKLWTNINASTTSAPNSIPIKTR